MTERNEKRGGGHEERSEGRRGGRGRTGPVGTLFGAAFGPVGAAVGSVVDPNRLAFAFRFGAGLPRSAGDDDGLEDATTIEIEDAGEDEATANEDCHGRDG